jgi:lactate dehydrogenase-like 2-hydroxyacid dehydrogenase
LTKNTIVTYLPDTLDILTQQYSDLAEPPVINAISTKTQEEHGLKELCDATIIIANPSTPYMSKKKLKTYANVKFVQFTSVGYNKIDTDAATELGILVANNPGWNSVTVAEHTLMLMLMILKKVEYGQNKYRTSGWTMPEVFGFWNQARDLNAKTVGIVGYGSIGRELSKRLNAFNVNVLYYKRNKLSSEEEESLGVQYRDFSSLLGESDIVSLHTPLTDETRNLINLETIKMMKEGALIINTARQEVVDETAVAEALDSGILGGYGTDRLKTKRVDGRSFLDSQLVDMDNVVFTQGGGVTKESRATANVQYMENVRRFLNGKDPIYLVNKPSKPER